MLNPRLFALLVLGFILATIIGTVSHELGHIAVANALGNKTELHYDSMHVTNSPWEKLMEYYDANKKYILNRAPSPQKDYFETQRKKLETESFYVTLGGPLQTILTGSIGLGLLWFRRKKIQDLGLKLADWLFIFLAFFWSRQVFNCAMAILHWILKGKRGGGGDEYHIDHHLELPLITTNVIAGAVAAALLAWVVFWVIPKQQRVTFIVSGLVGSALGFWIWMYWLGPELLPKGI